MSWEKEFIARHSGWIQQEDIWAKITSLPAMQCEYIALYVFACICVCKKMNKMLSWELAPFPASCHWLHLKTAGDHFLSCHTGWLVPPWEAVSFWYGTWDWSEIWNNTPIEGWSLLFVVRVVLASSGAAWSTCRTWTRFELGCLQINLSL